MKNWHILAAVMVAASVSGGTLLADIPQYSIVDIGLVSGDSSSQGLRMSPNGIAVGRSLGSGHSYGFSWTLSGGFVSLPNLTSPARNYGLANGVNDGGDIVGTGCSTSYGSNPLPLLWKSGAVSQLPLPSGQTRGAAWDINNGGVAVGSVNTGSSQRGTLYANGVGSVITQTTSTGCYAATAYAINDAGLVVGAGWDPNDAGRNVGYVIDTVSGSAFEVGALPDCNGAICYNVSENGYVVGSSMQGMGSSRPFIWSKDTGMTEIPLAAGTILGSARGVNSAGWVVGNDSSDYAIPFLYDGSTTYRLADLLPAGTGWDLETNTSSSAMGISDSGVILGTGVYNGSIHAYAMIPVPEPMTLALLALTAIPLLRRRR